MLATLGVALQYAGRTGPSLRAFEEARPLTPPHRMPRLLLRRAHALHHLGRHREALADLDRAVAGSRDLADPLWEARSLNNRSMVHLALGQLPPAEADAEAAERLYAGLGHDLEATQASHNRAYAVLQRGDVPRALRLLDAVTARYRELDAEPPELAIDHVQALLTVGLAREARDVAEGALATAAMPRLVRAETLLVAARAALDAGDLPAGQVHAVAAAGLFRGQRRPGWEARARLLSLQIRHRELAPESREGGRPDAGTRRAVTRLRHDTAALATTMADRGDPETTMARLLHAQVARTAGRPEDGVGSLRAAAGARHTGPPLTRTAGWLAAALLAEQEGDRRALLRACRRGLDAVDEHRETLGDQELRALASGHGLELARLAVRAALEGGTARDLLWWAERWRATALTAPPSRPDDDGLAADVGALRDVVRRLTADEETGQLRRERARLESSIRHRHRHLRGTGAASDRVDLADTVAHLGGTVLLHLVDVDGVLHAVTVAGGRTRRRRLGSSETARQEAAYAVFSLRRAAHGRPLDLDVLGRRLQSAVLGDRASGLLPAGAPDVEVVVIPPAHLLSLPWGILPVLAPTRLRVAPSLATWTRAASPRTTGTRTAGAPRGTVALVTGPGLTTDQEEVARVAGRHPDVRVLGGAEATVEAALTALDGAVLGHVAAHGTYRADAPLFSDLRLADGPLMVHDLERLRRPPAAMVLSACDSAGLTPVAADEALGLVSSLLALGTRTVVASVAPVNDRATVAVMDHVHAAVAAGGTLADGLRAARLAEDADPVARATAGSFTAFGA